MRRALTVLVALAMMAACDGSSSLTEPGSRNPGSAGFGISDGAHTADGLTLGNEDFFLLPPLVPMPSVSTFKDRPFHATIRPRIVICLLKTDGTGCEATVKEFAPEAIGVSATDEAYQVDWDTKEQSLLTSRYYRIGVLVQQTLLGYADVDPLRNGSELRNVNTDEYIPLVDGRTLPIRFRIEQGATCEFKPCTEVIVDRETGGTFHAPDGGAAIQIPPNAMPVDDVLLIIERKPVLANELCISDPATPGFVFLQWEGCYVLRTDPDLATTTPRGFQEPVIVGVCIEPGVPERYRDNIELLKHDDGVGIQRFPSVAAPFLDCTDFTGTPSPISGRLLERMRFELLAMATRAFRLLEPRALFAVDGGLGTQLPVGSDLSTFFWGLPITATKLAGDLQTVPVNTAVPVTPTLEIRTAHDHPEHPAQTVELAPVTFRIPAGSGGSLIGPEGPAAQVEALSNADGVVMLPAGWAWHVGPTAGTYLLEAAGPFTHAPVVFSAEASGTDLAIAITGITPAEPTTASDTRFQVTVTNTGGPSPQTTASFDFGTTAADPATLTVPAMATGDVATLGVPARTLPAGTFTATAILDPANQVVETDETNNTATLQYTVAARAQVTIGVETGEGDAVAGANVTLRRTTDGASFSGLTNADGIVMLLVPPGTYDLTIEMVGFVTEQVSGLDITESLSFDITLEEAGPTLQLLGTDGSETSDLIDLDPVTGASTFIGNTRNEAGAIRNLQAMAAHPTTNVVYGSSGANFYSVDPSSAVMTLLGLTPQKSGFLWSLDFDADGTLWGVLDEEGFGYSADRLVTVDLEVRNFPVIHFFKSCTGPASECPVTGVEAIAWDPEGRLWGVINDRQACTPEPRLVRIDPTTGIVTAGPFLTEPGSEGPEPIDGAVLSMQFLPDGRLVAGTGPMFESGGGRFVQIDWSTGQVTPLSVPFEGSELSALSLIGGSSP